MTVVDTSTEFGAHVAERLERDELIWLTTVSADGTPVPTLVWFLWTNGEFLIHSQPDKPKLRHIARNPRVGLHLDSNAAGNDVVVLTGEARAPAEPTTEEEADRYFRKYAKGIEAIGMTPESLAREFSVPIRVTPQRLRGWV
ncbi:TIGR03667 family PPOX class F420-dependent oxidoreductase [Actinopolymorpha rutila]|uniref:PPOX class probable F420-dependent enzyme n=1 Tax=Actinopolymorpha rutila TaxID=446787 RepID=A0A852ZJ82_9ACTN|nr:TIGR03667 family PPOX class F420-dependent oxidoreductase [Actinopolymorpha rutila]NYH91672.1 PPOX class probable F420-dependent enzyme [Actinopolymorpha rutila]